MPREKGLVEGNVFQTHDALAGVIGNYPVHQQKRKAVRQKLDNLFMVKGDIDHRTLLLPFILRSVKIGQARLQSGNPLKELGKTFNQGAHF
jgi:hypothetical protein